VNTGSSGEKRADFLRRSAKEIKNYKVTMRILLSALIMLLILTSVMYAISALYNNSGSFTVSVDKVEMTKYGLSLSEHRDMSYASSSLNAKIHEKITNIAGESIPDNVDDVDGVNNGPNYIAYTFYLQNAGEVEVPCEYQVQMSAVSNGLDEAIRVRLYVDGVPTTYAKTKSSGDGPEPFTEPFYSSVVMAKGRIDRLLPGDVRRFTVVIWIEGNDPDCLDGLIGGQMKIDMNFGIVH
jgi:hypothetical protein